MPVWVLHFCLLVTACNMLYVFMFFFCHLKALCKTIYIVFQYFQIYRYRSTYCMFCWLFFYNAYGSVSTEFKIFRHSFMYKFGIHRQFFEWGESCGYPEWFKCVTSYWPTKLILRIIAEQPKLQKRRAVMTKHLLFCREPRALSVWHRGQSVLFKSLWKPRQMSAERGRLHLRVQTRFYR